MPSTPHFFRFGPAAAEGDTDAAAPSPPIALAAVTHPAMVTGRAGGEVPFVSIFPWPETTPGPNPATAHNLQAIAFFP